MDAGAIIIAAGKSSRMGSFKPLLKIGGVSAAEHVISNFHLAGIRNIVIVTGNNAEGLENSLKHLDVLFLRNNLYESTEMFDSVKIGLGYLKDKCGKIFVTPVDIPLFTADTVKTLLNCRARAGIPVFNGTTGHPIVLDGKGVNDILKYAGSGGLHGAITNLSLEIEHIEVSDSGILYDMDTQADYAKIIKLHKERLTGPQIGAGCEINEGKI